MASTIYHATTLTRDVSLTVGQAAPDFQLQTETGDYWRLSNHRGKLIVLLFYAKDETFVCTRQLCSLRDQWDKYQETGATVLGVSVGSTAEHKSFSRNHRLPIPLLADVSGKVTETYGNHWFYPTFFMRSIVIIDGKGTIRRRDVMLRAIRPSDQSVIASIYAAKAEILSDREPLPVKRHWTDYRV